MVLHDTSDMVLYQTIIIGNMGKAEIQIFRSAYYTTKE